MSASRAAGVQATASHITQSYKSAGFRTIELLLQCIEFDEKRLRGLPSENVLKTKDTQIVRLRLAEIKFWYTAVLTLISVTRQDPLCRKIETPLRDCSRC